MFENPTQQNGRFQAAHTPGARSGNPKAPPPRSLLSTAEIFRAQIEKAEAEGAARKDMILHVTFSDASHLKRDRAIAVSDISFKGGVMRFFGVRVEQGGVIRSVLDLGDGAALHAVERPAPPPKPKPKPRAKPKAKASDQEPAAKIEAKPRAKPKAKASDQQPAAKIEA